MPRLRLGKRAPARDAEPQYDEWITARCAGEVRKKQLGAAGCLAVASRELRMPLMLGLRQAGTNRAPMDDRALNARS